MTTAMRLKIRLQTKTCGPSQTILSLRQMNQPPRRLYRTASAP